MPRPINEQLGTPDFERVFGFYIEDLACRGRQWRTQCPIHGGDRDSFSIEAETGYWTCHSGCGGAGGDVIQFVREMEKCEFIPAVKKIETILGRDLLEKQQPKRGRLGTIVRDYKYHLPDGSPFLRVVRYEPKDFRQQSWNEADQKWEWRTHGRDKEIVYNAPLLAQAGIVYVVEGEKDADALVEGGLAATCNPGGAGKWTDKHSTFLRDKHVVIIPDNDEPGRAHGIKVARSLSRSGAASVRVLELQGEGVKDVSDWLGAGHTVEELGALAGELSDWEEPKDDQESAASPTEVEPPHALPEVPIPGDEHYEEEDAGLPQDQRIHPNELARQILRERLVISDRNKNVYEYREKKWEQITIETLRHYALRADNAFHTTHNRRNEVANYVVAQTYLQNIPWRTLAPSEVAFRNGVFDLETWQMRDHRPEDYLEWYPPVDLDESAQCPRWQRALHEWFDSSKDPGLKIAAVQEFFGYVLMPEALFKKSMYLIGSPNTGKSLFLKVLSAMVGPEGVVSISPEDMGDPRKVAPIKGKALNVVGEVDSSEIFSDAGFKILVSTGDTITIDQKFERAHSYRPFAKHVLCSNDFPQIRDTTDATFQRILFVGFTRIFEKNEQDPFLEHALSYELPGITAWALQGAKRLWNNRGQFTHFAEAQELLEECQRENNPVVTFIEEFLIQSAGVSIPFSQIHAHFNKWNHRNVSHRTLENLFRRAGFKVSVRDDAGAKKRHLIDLNYSNNVWRA